MGNELVSVDAARVVAQWEDPNVLIKRRERMVQLMTQAMKNGQHFGKVPGCKQNTLFQPGSQLLSVSFRIGHEPSNIEDLSTEDEKRYRVTDRVFDQATGVTLGFGIGECSSSEEKYAWKRCYIQQEFDATPIDRRKIKYSEYNGKVTETKMIRTNPADVANTILKMARKRANVNGTIEVLAASDVFTQDVEDLPEGMDLGDDRTSSKAGMAPPTESAQGAPGEDDQSPSDEERKKKRLISEKQERLVYGKCKGAKVDPEAVKNYIAVQHRVPRGHFWMLTWSSPKQGDLSEFDRILKTIEEKPEFFQKYMPIKTAGNASASEAAPAPTQTTDTATTPAQEKAEPTPQEQFELAVQASAESLGKNMVWATNELCKAFKVKALSEIQVKDQVDAIKHLQEVA